MAVLVAVLVGIAGLVPVPYVTLGPGPVCNTVGRPTATCPSQYPNSLIRITPASAMHAKRDVLALTTVDVSSSVSLLAVLQAYLSHSEAVVPREVLFPPGESAKQVDKANANQMTQSQDSATVVALTHLGLVSVLVHSVQAGSPAAGRLRVGDTIRALDGAPVGNTAALLAAMGRVRPGQKVVLTVLRNGRSRTVSVVTAAAPGDAHRAFLGVSIANRLGVHVSVGVKGIGGPSAGLMLSLGIFDELVPYSLTGGRVIAGTGTIDDLGNVGPIGGIQQKMYAARHHEHASVFLAPAGDCAEARGNIPAGLQVVRVRTFDGALADLAALRAGRTNLPSC